MRRIAVTLIAAAALALAAAPLAIAATDTATDARGDVEGSPPGGDAAADLVRATAGRDSHGNITQTVTIAGAAPNPSGGGIVPFLYLEMPTMANGMSECAAFVGQFNGRLGVFRCGTGHRIGWARIVRTSRHTTRYTFSPRALGNPASYDWAVYTRSRSSAPGSWTQYDRLPSTEYEYFTYSLR